MGFFGPLIMDYEYIKNFNITYSYPLLNSGVSILTYREIDKWLFIKVISLDIAILVIFTAFFISVLHYYLEKKVNPFEYYLWNEYANIFFISSIHLKNPLSKLI